MSNTTKSTSAIIDTKKAQVVFEHADGHFTTIGYTKIDVFNNEENINSFDLEPSNKLIHSFLKERFPHFKSYYTRITGPFSNSDLCKIATGTPTKSFVMDVGSHVEFFHVLILKEPWDNKENFVMEVLL